MSGSRWRAPARRGRSRPRQALPRTGRPPPRQRPPRRCEAETAAAPGDITPQALAAARAEAARHQKIDRSHYQIVRTLEELDGWIARARDLGIVAIDTETSSLDPMQASLCGFSLALSPDEACYVPLEHRQNGHSGADGLFAGDLAADQIPESAALAAIKPLLEDAGILKVGQNLKFDWLVFAQRGIEMAPQDDTMLMSYVLDAGRSDHGLDPLAQRYFGHKTIDYNEVVGSGKSKLEFDNVTIERAAEYAAEDADVTLRLWQLLKPRLTAEHMNTVYETLERPLVPVLARMERRGISIDRQVLSRLSGEFAQRAMGLEEEIRTLAGEPVNPGSPKQIGDILFGKLRPAGRHQDQDRAMVDRRPRARGAGRAGPRAAAEAPRLAAALEAAARPIRTRCPATSIRRPTGVHTSYALAATTTGRLSSSEPNLQNIPVRTEEGRKIRARLRRGARLQARLAPTIRRSSCGCSPHIADIPALQAGVPRGPRHPRHDGVRDVRRAGQGHAGRGAPPRQGDQLRHHLRHLGLRARQPARHRPRGGRRLYQEILRALPRHPRLHGGDQGVLQARTATCSTLFGRKCHYPDIVNSNASIRSFNERAAINARLQGTAADIIRRAMVRMDAALAKAEAQRPRCCCRCTTSWCSRCREGEVAKTLPVVTKVMEHAPLPALDLSVPLSVDARAADNWDEAH